MATNVPAPYLGPNGYVIPTDSQILAGVMADLQSAFGGNLNPALNTPQGQLASSMASIISNAYQFFQFYVTQVDPNYSTGRMQDAIGQLYNIERLPAEPTMVACVCTGANGTIIQTGALAADTSGNVYNCVQGGTIPSAGNITLNFQNNVFGAIPCVANTLTQIYQAVPGWDTVNNTSDGTLGQDVESRAAFETRREAAVEANSIGSLPSVLGSVLSVSGVTDAYVTENTTGSPVTIGGVSIAAHALYVAAVGGGQTDIATAIWKTKAPGCSYVGTTDVTIYDTSPGYTSPYPSYDVKFTIPAGLTIFFAVTLVNSTTLPTSATVQVQNAIINAFAGNDGGPRPTIGSNVLASRFYSPIAVLGPWAQIQSVYIGSANTASVTFTGAIAGTVLSVSGVTGTLAIGQVIVDTTGTLIEGTRIISGSGSTWGVNYTQTVASESMSAINLTLLNIQTNINQIPTVTNLGIFVGHT